MNRQALLRIEILNMIMRFMVIFTMLSIVLLSVSGSDRYIWKSLILLQASILSFIIRKCTRHIWSFLALHLVLAAAYYLITEDPVLRAVYIIYIVIYALTEFILDMKGKVRNTTLALSVIFLIMYAICEYVFPQERMLRGFFFCIAFLFGLLYVLNMYFVNFYYYFTKHEDKADVPLKQIRTSNTFFMTVFLSLTLTIMLLFSRLPIVGVMRLIGKLIVRFLRFVLAGMAKKPEELQPQVTEEIAEDPYYNYYEEMEVPQPSQFWITVSKVVITICSVAAVVIIIALIIYGLYRVYQMYYSKKLPDSLEEKAESVSPFLKADLSIGGAAGSGSLRRSLRNLFGGSNNDRIRKHYLKAIQKHTDPNKMLKYKTPSELSKYAVAAGETLSDDQVQQQKEAALTTLYEKARYSNRECSKEEVQSVKELLK